MNKLVIFAAFVFVCIQGAEIFVSPGASGGNGSASLPYGSIQQALNAASNNDTITLFNGTYSGNANTALTNTNLLGITLRSFSNDPLSTIIKWNTTANPSFWQVNSQNKLTVRGIWFKDRVFSVAADSTFGLASNAQLVISNCRFENFTSTSSAPIYILSDRQGSLVTITDTLFINSVSANAITVSSNLQITSSSFVSHPGDGQFGSCIIANRAECVVNIANTSFVNCQSPLSLDKGNVTLTGLNFYNTTNAVRCLFSSVVASGVSFCGGSTTNCTAVPATNVRPFDGCGICNGNNQNKDCNGACWGTSRGSSCNARKTIWVSSSGSGSGTSKASPASLVSAVSQANYGDTIILLTGNYTGSNLNVNLANKQGITIRSEHGIPEYDNVTFTCNGQTNKTAFTFQGQSFDFVLQGISITECGGQSFGGSLDVGAVYVSPNTGVTLQSVIFSYNGVSTYMGGTVRLLDGFVKTNDVTFAHSTGYRGAAVYGTASSGLTVSYLSAVNTRFLYSNATISGVVWMSGSVVEVSNSYFTQASAFSSGAALSLSDCYYQINSNSFSYIEGQYTIGCTLPRAGSSGTNNTYCGTLSTLDVSCPGIPNPNTFSNVDACGVCNGGDSVMDCSQACWGYQVRDPLNVCCYYPSEDCAGFCYGPHYIDPNGNCVQ